MRAALLLSAFILGASSSGAGSQPLPPSGAGTSNAINQQFQTQNQIRGLQQQQNFDANTFRLQSQTNQMYNAPRHYGPGYIGVRRGGGGRRSSGAGRLERER